MLAPQLHLYCGGRYICIHRPPHLSVDPYAVQEAFHPAVSCEAALWGFVTLAGLPLAIALHDASPLLGWAEYATGCTIMADPVRSFRRFGTPSAAAAYIAHIPGPSAARLLLLPREMQRAADTSLQSRCQMQKSFPLSALSQAPGRRPLLFPPGCRRGLVCGARFRSGGWAPPLLVSAGQCYRRPCGTFSLQLTSQTRRLCGGGRRRATHDGARGP